METKEETLEQFLQALQYELTEFSKYENLSLLTREDWFDKLMNFFEFYGLGNMKNALLQYIEEHQIYE